ncbi:ATP-binding protein [Paenibacillus wulumuqiensis]|uniref:ATP-binding protein n=1 Tax=Paenibacillus wulumuqiensis TaxID=1567107 RepID=UPI000696B796|nr:ATP-binding protein [Paenibacillus wulumuqiensis]
MLAVGSAVFLFSNIVERSGDDSLHSVRLTWRGYSPILMLSSAFSIVICWILSIYSAITLEIQMSLVALVIGVLYIGAARGLLLLILETLMYLMLGAGSGVIDFLVHSGVLLYPAAALCSPHFAKSSLRQKRLITWLLILLSATLTMLAAGLRMRLHNLDTGTWWIILLIVGAAMIAGSYSIQAIERIMERKQLNQQMLELSNRVITEAEKLRQIMNVAPMMITSIDADGQITAINERALAILKRSLPDITKETALDVNLFKLNPETITPGLKHTIEIIQQLPEEQVIHNELMRLDYGTFYISVAPIRQLPEHNLTGVVIIAQDITEVERLRNELSHVEQLSLVGKMAASITHEIRNPMAVVRGFLQLMREKSPASLDHYYLIVMDELDRANSIINDFLSLAQNRIVEKQLYDLHAIIEELLPLLWADANLRGQSIAFIPGQDVPRLDLNSKEIKQLILNLARNGMEAMEDKGELTIETEATAHEVIMRIRDTGPGIPQEKLDKLFEPFYTTKAKGTGLGLSLCLSIVERHQGRIVVDSVEGEGTTFSVIFSHSFGPKEEAPEELA